jgi:cytidylate kinase
MSVVTLSAAFGAGGWVVGPAVAERLNLPFLDRAIPKQVAAGLGVEVEDAEVRDERVKGWLMRLLAGAAPMSAEFMLGNDPPRATLMSDSHYLERTQEVLRRAVADGGGVILGRAGALVLADCPGALHVRLDGDPERRARQAASLSDGDFSEREAMRALRKDDTNRANYIRHFYNADPADPRLYHLTLDSTRLSFDTCIDLIVAAYRAPR